MIDIIRFVDLRQIYLFARVHTSSELSIVQIQCVMTQPSLRLRLESLIQCAAVLFARLVK